LKEKKREDKKKKKKQHTRGRRETLYWQSGVGLVGTDEGFPLKTALFWVTMQRRFGKPMGPIFRDQESKDNLWVPSSGVKNPRTTYGSHLQGSRIQGQLMGPIFRGQESKDNLWVPSSRVKNPRTTYGSHLQGSRIQGQPMGPIFRGKESKDNLWVPSSGVKNPRKTYGSHLQGSRIQGQPIGSIFRGSRIQGQSICHIVGQEPVKMGPISCPATSVRKHHYPLRNNPEECSSQILRGGSLK